MYILAQCHWRKDGVVTSKVTFQKFVRALPDGFINSVNHAFIAANQIQAIRELCFLRRERRQANMVCIGKECSLELLALQEMCSTRIPMFETTIAASIVAQHILENFIRLAEVVICGSRINCR